MSICKSCGAEIRWIETKTGKMMPVNPYPHIYKRNTKGPCVLVTAAGEVVRCEPVEDGAQADGVGYVSHFATCPAAAEHRQQAPKEYEKPKELYICDRKKPCSISVNCGVDCFLTTDPAHKIK